MSDPGSPEPNTAHPYFIGSSCANSRAARERSRVYLEGRRKSHEEEYKVLNVVVRLAWPASGKSFGIDSSFSFFLSRPVCYL